jgi:hypothetical protein
MSKDKRRKEVRLAEIVSRADCKEGYFCVNLTCGGRKYDRETQECVLKGYLKRVRTWRRKYGGRQYTKLFLTDKGKSLLKKHGYTLYENQEDPLMEDINRYHRHMSALSKRIIMERHQKRKFNV